MGTSLGIRLQPASIPRPRIGAATAPEISPSVMLPCRSRSTNLEATKRACRPLVMARRRNCEEEEGGREPEDESWKRRIVRTLLIDNYDSYTYNVFQELTIVNGVPPVVVRNDEWTWEDVQYYLYEEQAFDNIVISPGPGSPACPTDIGICLQILLDCKDIPILGVCLGHQALGFVHGAQIVHAPEPVHGRLSEIEHSRSPLFNDIPSGKNSGFKVVRYHSLVIDADSLPKELIPTAWTTSASTLPFLGTKKSDLIHDVSVNGTCQWQPVSHFHSYSKDAGLSRLTISNNLERTEVIMGVMHSTRPHYGVQFHPESVATHHGRKIFENFKRITVDHGLKSLMLRERKVSPACMSSKGLAKSKLVNFEVATRRWLDICSSPVLTCKTGLAKHLKLQWKKIDCLLSQVAGPETIFCELFGDNSAKDTFWLDSASIDQGRARFSFMGGKGGSLWKQITFQLSGPSKMTNKIGGYLTIQDGFGPEKRMFLEDGFFEFLKKELQSFDHDKEDFEMLPFDFCGGFVGFIGYDLKVECGASSNCHKSKTPDACFFFADNLIVIDHWNGDVYILSLHDVNCPDTAIRLNGSLKENSWLAETEQRLLRLKSMATGKVDVQKLGEGSSTPSKESFMVEKSRHQYTKDVEKCLKFIRDGETYELCLTTQMRKRVGKVDALKLYINLRDQNPAPYAAWLNFSKENLVICCSSPERFLQLDQNGMLEAKPIKGTIARGRTLEEDKSLRLQLQYSEKDQAENLMIVDLLRNDLGRVCEPGTVCVPHLMQVESYATVHTLVSTIQGKKKPHISPVDCVRAAFPGGSMTGAPKLRSMELLDSLESCSRGVYSGSIGFFSYNQTFDLNIVIRTVVIHNGEASVGAGGAIVALSDPEDEYEEMMLKAKAPTKVVEQCTLSNQKMSIRGQDINQGRRHQTKQLESAS